MPFRKCCNIFQKQGHSRAIDLRRVTPLMIEKAALLDVHLDAADQYICNSCRIKLFIDAPCATSDNSAMDKENREIFSSGSSSEQERISPTLPEVQNDNIADLNNILGKYGESPIRKRHISSNNYKKIVKVTSTISEKIFCSPSPEILPPNEVEESKAWLIGLITAFTTAETRREKMFLLTTLPRGYWSVERIEREFKTSKRLACDAMQLLERNGPYSYPEKKPVRHLSSEIISKVETYYRTDDISRNMPGMQDKVTVIEGLEKVVKTKRLLLWILDDIYQMFIKEYPDVKISFSKFASLRPKECVLAGSTGTHNVCVCMTHENVSLMCKPVSKFFNLRDERSLLKNLMCSKYTVDCATNKCSDCEGIAEKFKNELLNLLQAELVEYIYFDQWIMQDRYSLTTVCKNADEFVESLMNKSINQLKLHDFISRNQSEFLKDKKKHLMDGEYIFIMDYSENYNMVTQDEIQAAHFNKVQATIHPIVAYYKDKEGELKCLSFTVISDSLMHNTLSVHLYQSKCIDYIRKHNKNYPAITKIYYFTDGSAAQYKNKKYFANLCHHQHDFGVPAECHFFATSHGKGPSDGLGGTLKRETRRASLRGTKISTAAELFRWAVEWSNKSSHIMKFCFVLETEVEQHEAVLYDRFSNLKTIKGTQVYHCFIKDDSATYGIIAKMYSYSDKLMYFKLKN